MQITDIQIDQNRRETTQHGSYGFPVAVYLDQLDQNLSGYVNWHWHEELQLSLVTRGTVEFLVNQRPYLLREGQGIFINSGCLHMAQPADQLDSTYICINFDPKMLAVFPGSILEQKYVLPFLKQGFSSFLFSPETDWQLEVLEQIKQIWLLDTQRPFGYELDISLILASIGRQLITRQEELPFWEDAQDALEQQRIKALLAYLHEHYAEKITLAQIAASVNLSTGECCRFFKRIVKSTLFEYLLAYRLQKSRVLLQETDMTISQIADATGFGSTSYYIECFRKQLDATPKTYRKALKLAAQGTAPFKKKPPLLPEELFSR